MLINTGAAVTMKTEAFAQLPDGWKIEDFVKYMEEIGNKVVEVREDGVVLLSKEEVILKR